MYPYVRPTASISSRHSHMCSSALEPGSSISFQLTGDQGAALLTKYSTYREDAELGRVFEVYTKEHYDSWVAFARKRGHPDDIKPVLVTGIDLTRAFAMMSYLSDGDDPTAEFKTSTPGVPSPWGAWRTAGVVHTNCGPQSCRRPTSAQSAAETSSGSSHTETISDGYNQCVFIRYYTVRKRLGIPRVIRAAAGPHDLGPGKRDDEEFEIKYSSGDYSNVMPSLFDDDRGGDRSSTTSTDSKSEAVVHNTNPVRSCSRPSASFPHSNPPL